MELLCQAVHLLPLCGSEVSYAAPCLLKLAQMWNMQQGSLQLFENLIGYFDLAPFYDATALHTAVLTAWLFACQNSKLTLFNPSLHGFWKVSAYDQPRHEVKRAMSASDVVLCHIWTTASMACSGSCRRDRTLWW